MKRLTVRRAYLKPLREWTPMQDIFLPESSSEEALVSPLHTVTYVTSEPRLMERILTEAYDLVGSGWSELDEASSIYLGFSRESGVRINIFRREGEAANVMVRLIHQPAKVDPVRPDYSGLYPGGATLSFPMRDLLAHEKRMNALGVHSTIGVKEMDFTSPTGEVYTSAEIVYKAPDNAFLMGVKRPDVFVPTGPIDANTGTGGPSYSARCLVNADATLGFFRDVLRFEVRRDVIFEVGEKSALLMPQGTKERFMQCFTPGSKTGYLVLMDHHEATRAEPPAGYGPPSRGIVMWSFATTRFDEVAARIRDEPLTVLKEAAELRIPLQPHGRCMIVEDPEGFPIEIFEIA